MNFEKRYHVYAWTSKDINSYTQYFGKFEILPNTTKSITQYGTCVLDTDDKKQAEKEYIYIFDKYSYENGEVSIFDSKENIWFN